jgi:hypothetical protein|tara:strand:- start:244 stop:372 length:129 start_codon:yes stop_codon:yes gene_type:complete
VLGCEWYGVVSVVGERGGVFGVVADVGKHEQGIIDLAESGEG